MSYTDLAYEDIGTVDSTYMREELVGKVQERVNDGQVWVLSLSEQTPPGDVDAYRHVRRFHFRSAPCQCD